MRPTKYRDNISFIFENDCLERDSLSFGINIMMPSSNNWLSFKKKNDINKTENNPTLKLPNPLMIEFKKLGMIPKSIFENILESFKDCSTSIRLNNSNCLFKKKTYTGQHMTLYKTRNYH